MALSESSLKSKIITEISNVITITDATQLDKVAGAIAKALVDEITTNAIVNPTALLDSMSGPVTGTGTIS